MKHTVLLFAFALILFSCNSSGDKTVKDAKTVENGIKEMKPGTIPTTDGGWTMKAKIDGKEWVANSIYPPEAAGRISGDNGSESIGLPYDRRDMVVGNKTKFSHNNAVDLMVPSDDGGILGGYKGEMEITKVDANWAEGTFSFTGSSSSSTKTVEVTDGFFRISMKP